jgi:hypothetical protein
MDLYNPLIGNIKMTAIEEYSMYIDQAFKDTLKILDTYCETKQQAAKQYTASWASQCLWGVWSAKIKQVQPIFEQEINTLKEKKSLSLILLIENIVKLSKNFVHYGQAAARKEGNSQLKKELEKHANKLRENAEYLSSKKQINPYKPPTEQQIPFSELKHAPQQKLQQSIKKHCDDNRLLQDSITSTLAPTNSVRPIPTAAKQDKTFGDKIIDIFNDLIQDNNTNAKAAEQMMWCEDPTFAVDVSDYPRKTM